MMMLCLSANPWKSSKKQQIGPRGMPWNLQARANGSNSDG